MTLTADDRLWRDQNIPGVSDDELEKIVETFGKGVDKEWKKLFPHDSNADGEGEGKDEKQKQQKKQEQIDIIAEIVNRYHLKLFKDEYEIPHSTILVNDHLEVLPINGSKFETWLMGIFYRDFNDILSAKELKELVDILNAKAVFESGDPIKLNLRVAQRRESSRIIWDYDLTNKNHEFIEITSEGWGLMKNDNSDLILFRRYSNQLPQVYPTTADEPDILDKFINLLLNKNLHDEDNRSDIVLLVKSYIISLFIPEIPKPVLMPYGHQGSAKTSLMESIKMLVDPSRIKTLTFPRDLNELIQQLSHNYVNYYDNISRLSDWISDQICRAVSGSGSSKRQLYTDDDDVIRSFKRCIGLNGVNLAATKPDLLDRGIPIHLKRIEEEDRLIIDDIEKELSKMVPQLLAYIFDILVKVLKFKETEETGITEYPRMADFAEHGEIISRCMGFKPFDFMKAYKNNVKLQIDEIIESSDVAICLVYMMFTRYGDDEGDPRQVWEGTASALLGELNVVAITEDLNVNVKDRRFPKHGNTLRKRLNEIVPTLKEKGLEITFFKTTDKKRLRIIKIRKVSSEPSDRPMEEN